MKTLLIIAIALFSHQTFAQRICYGIDSDCQRRNLTCGNVQQLDENTFRITKLHQITGCLAWGVSQKKSKQQICKKMLKQMGVTHKVSYLPGTQVSGEWDTAYGNKSIGQIDCVVKP